MVTEIDQKIIRIVLQMLPSEQDALTTEKIRDTVSNVVNLFRLQQLISSEESVNEDQLVKEIETLCNVFVSAISTLDDRSDH